MRSSLRVARWALACAIAALAGAAGGSNAMDYAFTPLPEPQASRVEPVPKYQFLYGDPSSWRLPIRWYYNHSRAPAPFDANPAGTLDQIRSALDSWTQVCGVTYVYEGETTIAPNTRAPHPYFGDGPDGVNVVGWDVLEPNTAGLAWVWFDPDTGGLGDGDIILSLDLVTTPDSMRRTATHEWGHALGLDHSDVGGAIMTGPPFHEYNALTTIQQDDVRGCRCLYGGPAANPAGFTCDIPSLIDFGAVPVGGASSPRTVTVTNFGNAPLTINNVAINSLRVTRDSGCAAGTVLPPGQRCAVTIVARPPIVFSYRDRMTINTSDGPYTIAVAYSGTNDPVSSPAVVQLVEYFHEAFGHYFITHLADEIAKLDNGTFAGWGRTGRTINAWTTPTAGSVGVCRFFGQKFAPKSSHFYTSFASECQTVKGDANWSFEGEVFHVGLPDAQGNCAAGTTRVFRLYNEGQSGAPNHRFTTDTTLRTQMIAQGWTPEGTGLGVTMCTPI